MVGLDAGAGAKGGAAVGGGAVGEAGDLFEGHVADQTRNEAAEPRVAGAGGVYYFYLVGGGGDGLRAVVEEAAFGVELDADEAAGHVVAERGDHASGIGFAG